MNMNHISYQTSGIADQYQDDPKQAHMQHLSGRDAECGTDDALLSSSTVPAMKGKGNVNVNINTNSRSRSGDMGVLKHVSVAATVCVSLLVVGVLYADRKQTQTLSDNNIESVTVTTTRLSASGGASTQTARKTDYSGKYARKEIRQLSEEELQAYFDTVWAMKETGRQDGRGYLNYYDDFVAQHALAASNTTMDQAHLFAGFVIWHSLLDYEFEIAIRSINPNVSIPYWDWTIDAATGDPASTDVLSDKYFGKGNPDNDYIVDTGYVAYFPVTKDYSQYVWWTPMSGYLRSADNDNTSPYVTRRDAEQEKYLPSSDDWNECLDTETFSTFWVCVWGTYGSYADYSLLHGGVHLFAGGTWNTTGGTGVGDFFDSSTSPNDPLWWSHHANLDRLWYQWRAKTGDALATDDDACGGFYGGKTVYPQPVGHNLWQKFSPEFYAFRTIDEITTLGGLTLNEACYYFNNDRLPYYYDETE